MNYPRVNLLKKSEQRYQGAVSRRFLLVCIVVTPILFLTVFSGIKLIQYTATQANLKSSRNLWAGLESRLTLYQGEMRSLTANKQALEQIKAWKGTQVPFSKLLGEIQGSVPANIQLMRLAVRGKTGPSVYGEPEDFALDHTLTLQGVAQGTRAEAVVLSLLKDLLKTERMGATFKSVKLGSMRRRVANGGEVMQDFRLDGSGAAGGKQ